MKRIVLLGLIIISSAALYGQGGERLNYTDENGLRQGRWVKYWENDNPQYEGFFKDGKLVGEFRRFHETGGTASLLIYKEGTDSVPATFYHPNGYLAAKGLYIGQNRQGPWEFYSFYIEDYLLIRELYSNNIKQGESIKYYWNGNVAEELFYIDDLKEGAWKQYFTDGILAISSTYIHGKLNGTFETFHTTGEKEITGTYSNDVRVGEWTFYNTDGTIKQTIIYRNGIPENNAELIKAETEYLDKLEREGGKIEDPEKTGRIW